MNEFEYITEDTRSTNEIELAAQVRSHLEREKKFLIVMDDMWDPEDWSRVSVALPTSNYRGKVLITSRYSAIGHFVNPHRKPVMLRLLTPEESVLLLKYEVFGEDSKLEPAIESYLHTIANVCMGFPLAIVLMGGMIGAKLRKIADSGAKVDAWMKLERRVGEIRSDDPTTMMDKVVSLSYEKLPYHLRACFLYFGMFPEGFEIPTWELFQMWIAEGFIQENMDFFGPEESYLEELINRNLVTVCKRSSDGRVKTCRVIESLRDFCIKRAGNVNESFLIEIKKSRDGTLESNTVCRRLCIHSNVSEFLASEPKGHLVCSFVCRSNEDLTLNGDPISAIPKGFKMLRVLDAKPMKFTTIPSDMFALFHLTYVALWFDSAFLPRQFSNLWNIQTLIVDTSQRFLEIKADIWKMRHLLHLKTNAIAILPEPAEDSAALEDESNIKTLFTISPESCSNKVLGRARNLRKVSVRGKLDTLLTSGYFDGMERLQNLEKLKLQNDVFPLASSDSPLPRLPPSHKFPPRLTILTLSHTFLDWSQMKVLASLYGLEVLKLKDGAFVGRFWDASSSGGFVRLRSLFVGRADLVVWKMSPESFPRLTNLELHNCQDLRKVPIELAYKRGFNVLNLKHCQVASASAKEIQRQKRESNHEFHLSIN